jgi:hypothetical protein
MERASVIDWVGDYVNSREESMDLSNTESLSSGKLSLSENFFDLWTYRVKIKVRITVVYENCVTCK